MAIRSGTPLPCLRPKGPEGKTRHPLEVAAVPREQDAVMAQHDAGDQTVRQADAHALAFEMASDLGGSVGRRVVQGQTRQGRQQVTNEPLLRTGLRARQELEREITVVRSWPRSSSKATRSAAGARPSRKSIRTSVSATIIARSSGGPRSSPAGSARRGQATRP